MAIIRSIKEETFAAEMEAHAEMLAAEIEAHETNES